MLRRAWLAATLRGLALDLGDSSAACLMGQTECLTFSPRARPNSFDGCRLAALAAQRDGCKERVAGQQLPRLQLDEAQASLRDTPDRPFVLEGAMHGWGGCDWDFDQLKQQHGGHVHDADACCARSRKLHTRALVHNRVRMQAVHHVATHAVNQASASCCGI